MIITCLIRDVRKKAVLSPVKVPSSTGRSIMTPSIYAKVISFEADFTYTRTLYLCHVY